MTTYLPFAHETTKGYRGQPSLSMPEINQKQNAYRKGNSAGRKPVTIRDLKRLRLKRAAILARQHQLRQTSQTDNLRQIPENNEAIFHEKPNNPVIQRTYADLVVQNIYKEIDKEDSGFVFEHNDSSATDEFFGTAATAKSSTVVQNIYKEIDKEDSFCVFEDNDSSATDGSAGTAATANSSTEDQEQAVSVTARSSLAPSDDSMEYDKESDGDDGIIDPLPPEPKPSSEIEAETTTIIGEVEAVTSVSTAPKSHDGEEEFGENDSLPAPPKSSSETEAALPVKTREIGTLDVVSTAPKTPPTPVPTPIEAPQRESDADTVVTTTDSIAPSICSMDLDMLRNNNVDKFERILMCYEDLRGEKSLAAETKDGHTADVAIYNRPVEPRETSDTASVNTSSSLDTFGFVMKQTTPAVSKTASASIELHDSQDAESVETCSSIDSFGFGIQKRSPAVNKTDTTSIEPHGAQDAESVRTFSSIDGVGLEVEKRRHDTSTEDPSPRAVENATAEDALKSVGSSANSNNSFGSSVDKSAAALLTEIKNCPSHNDAQFTKRRNSKQLQEEKQEEEKKEQEMLLGIRDNCSDNQSWSSSILSERYSSSMSSKARKLRALRLQAAIKKRNGGGNTNCMQPIQESPVAAAAATTAAAAAAVEEEEEEEEEEAKEASETDEYPGHSGHIIQVPTCDQVGVSCPSVISEISNLSEKLLLKLYPKSESKWDDMSSICVSVADQVRIEDNTTGTSKVAESQERMKSKELQDNNVETTFLHFDNGADTTGMNEVLEYLERIKPPKESQGDDLEELPEDFDTGADKNCMSEFFEYLEQMKAKEVPGHNTEEPSLYFDASVKTPPKCYLDGTIRARLEQERKISASRDPCSNESKWDDLSSIGLLGVETINKRLKAQKALPNENRAETENRKARNDIFRKRGSLLDDNNDSEGQYDATPSFSILWGDNPSNVKEKSRKKSIYETPDLEIKRTFSTVLEEEDYASYYTSNSTEEINDLEKHTILTKDEQSPPSHSPSLLVYACGKRHSHGRSVLL